MWQYPRGMKGLDRCYQLSGVELPAAAPTLTKLIKLTEKADVSISEVTTLLGFSPSLASRVIRLTNSGYYSLGRQVATLEESVQTIGLDAVRHLALASITFQWLHSHRNQVNFDLDLLRQHSVFVANLARAVSHEFKVSNPAEAFACGLMHDLGLVVSVLIEPKKFANLAEHASRSELWFDAEERQYDGVDHCILGAEVAALWNLPSTFARVLEFHHRPLTCHVDEPLVDIVHACDWAARNSGRSNAIPHAKFAEFPQAWERRGICTDTLMQLTQQLSIAEESIEMTGEAA